MEILKGQKFLCIKTVAMKPGGKIAYKKGECYFSEKDGCITTIQGNTNHKWLANGIAHEYFQLLHPEDEKTDQDMVNRPAHYTTGKIETVDFIEDKELNWHRGNALKYIVRAGLKDKSKEIEDLQKAIWYLEREIKRLS